MNEAVPQDNPFLQAYRGKRPSVLATLLAKQQSAPPSDERSLRIQAIRFVQKHPDWDGPTEPESNADETAPVRLGGWHPDNL